MFLYGPAPFSMFKIAKLKDGVALAAVSELFLLNNVLRSLLLIRVVNITVRLW